MRRALLSLAGLLFLPGCIHQALRTSTLDVASTVRDLQYQQVLNNLAMFIEDPYSIPSQVKLTGGLAQVADQLSPTYEVNIPGNTPVTNDFKITGQRQWTQSWSLSPVTEPDDVRKLRAVYQWAVRKKTRDEDFNKTTPNPPTTQPGSGTTTSLFFQPAITKADIPSPGSQTSEWLTVGKPGETPPKNAAYIGHYGNTYVWITPDHRSGFGDFVLLTLLKAPTKPTDKALMFGPALSPIQ